MYSSVSIDFRKRIPMLYDTYIKKTQQSFVDDPEFESDRFMVMLLRLQKYQEDVCQTFRYNDPDFTATLDLLRIQMNVKAFQAQLNEISQDIERLPREHPSCKLQW